MNANLDLALETPAERLYTLANLMELALYAPGDEVTHDGKAALQRTARAIVVLSAEIQNPSQPS